MTHSKMCSFISSDKDSLLSPLYS